MRLILVSVLVFLSTVSIFSQNNAEVFTGNWSGKINVRGLQLDMIFKISETDSGLVAKLDVPVQGAKDLPVSEVNFTNDSLQLKVAMIFGSYAGRVIDNDSISGKWSQNGFEADLNLKKTDSIAPIRRPQTPKPPFSYAIEEVEYTNPESGYKIAGTLTFPENAKDCPAVILISGSGAQDRNETIFEHKPFWVIADYLTRNGIAVLRVDDRGVGGSEGNIREATSDDFAGDVLAGINFLKKRKEIDTKKIGLIGHSEGGLIAPIVANRSNDVAFFVMLAGPGINGEQILYEQAKLLNKAAGLTEEQIAQNTTLQKAIFNILLNEKDSAKQIDRLQRTYSGGMYFMLPDERKKAIDAQIASVNTPWFRYFLTYDPYPALLKIKCPVLSLIGSKDLQVPAEINQSAIQKALEQAGNKNFKIMTVDNLNHLFQHCKTGSISEYAQIEETFSQEVLRTINDWIWKVVSN